MNKTTLTDEEKDEIWRKKILKELEEIIVEDWGEEELCEHIFLEGCARCDIYKALNNIRRIYGVQQEM